MTRDEAMKVWRAAYTKHNATAALTNGDADEAAATVIQQAFAEREEAIRQAGVQQGLDMAKSALEADAKLCDCFAHSEGECACGAWCEWKSITSARAVEIVSKLGGDDGTD